MNISQSAPHFVLLVAWVFVGPAAHSQEDIAPFANRAQFSAEIALLRQIATPEGVETTEQLDLNGVPQWVNIRGRHRNNPILLFIHGGPGTPMMPLAWAYQNGWEDYFTVVQWDQRGAGKNAASSDHTKLDRSVTIAQVIRDAETLIETLRKRFHKEKVVVLGFSFGSVIGIHIAKERPDLVSVYVGVGQAVGQTGEKILFDRTLEIARASNNPTAVKELESLVPYPKPDGSPPEEVFAVRRWAREFNGGWYGHKDFRLLYTLPMLSPEYTDADIRSWPDANTWFYLQMEKDTQRSDLRLLGPVFKVPIVFMMGRHDLHTPYLDAQNYFQTLEAPKKKLVTFERSAHFVMLEEPGKFLVSLVQEVLPLTEGAAVYTVDPDAAY